MIDSGIYLYWQGKKHYFYELCIQTIKKHNPNVTILDDAACEEILGQRIPACFQGVYLIHRIDWLRKKVIEKVGGLWLDADFVCFENLQAVANLAANFHYVGWREWTGGWMDNFFCGCVGSLILRDAALYALGEVEKYGKDVQWLATNSYAIDHAVEKHKWQKWACLPTHIIGPVNVTDVQWFLDDAGDDDLTNYHSLGFMTSFHGMGGWLNQRSEETFLRGNSRLAVLVRRGLK